MQVSKLLLVLLILSVIGCGKKSGGADDSIISTNPDKPSSNVVGNPVGDNDGPSIEEDAHSIIVNLKDNFINLEALEKDVIPVDSDSVNSLNTEWQGALISPYDFYVKLPKKILVHEGNADNYQINLKIDDMSCTYRAYSLSDSNKRGFEFIGCKIENQIIHILPQKDKILVSQHMTIEIFNDLNPSPLVILIAKKVTI